MVRVCLICNSYDGSSIEKLKFCKSIAITSNASCQANGRPMQPLMPLPNGFQQLGCSCSRRLNSSSNIRSGRNSSASSPYTRGSRWILGKSAMSGMLALTGYLPPMTVSSLAVIPMEGAVGDNRKDSRSTALRYGSLVRWSTVIGFLPMTLSTSCCAASYAAAFFSR